MMDDQICVPNTSHYQSRISSDSFLHFPDEICLLIARFLDLYDIIFSIVPLSRQWNRVAHTVDDLELIVPEWQQRLPQQNFVGIIDEYIFDFIADTRSFGPRITRAVVSPTVTDSALQSLTASVPNLRHLVLEKCILISDAALFHLRQTTRLVSLDLNGCRTLTDIGIKMFAPYLPALTALNLCNLRRISNSAIECIAEHLKHLKQLNLGYCWDLTDTALLALTGLTELEELSLSDCHQITDEGLSCISTALVNLRSLNLRWCSNITDDGVLSLQKLPKLRELNLSWCRSLTSRAVWHLAHMPLESLDLSELPFIDDNCLRIMAHGHGTLQAHLKQLRLCRGTRVTEEGIKRYLLGASDNDNNNNTSGGSSGGGGGGVALFPLLELVVVTSRESTRERLWEELVNIHSEEEEEAAAAKQQEIQQQQQEQEQEQKASGLPHNHNHNQWSY